MQSYSNNVQDTKGNAYTSASVLVKTSAGLVATIYSDNGITTQANPITPNSTTGQFSFYAADGDYTLTITGAGPVSVTPVKLFDGIDSTAALAASGGAGLAGFSHANTYAAGTLGAKEKQVVSVKDAPYNAVGDGVADDTTAVTNARAASSQLLFSRGNFLISTQIEMGMCSLLSDSSASIKGNGFKITGSAPSGIYRMTMRDFMFDGTGFTNASAGCLKITHAHKGGFYDIRIANYSGVGNNSLVVTTAFLSSFYNLSVQSCLYGASFTNQCNQTVVYQGTFANNTNFGAYLRSSIGFVFDACDFETNAGGGLIIDNTHQADENSCTANIVRNCYFEGNTSFDIEIGTGAGGDVTRAIDTKIIGSVFTGPGTYSIKVDYATGTLIEDNTFTVGGYSSKDIWLTANSRNTTIIPFTPARTQVDAGATVSQRTIQTGTASLVLNASGFATTTVTFAAPYDATSPIVLLTMYSGGNPGAALGDAQVQSLTTSGFTLAVYNGPASGTVAVQWRAGA